MTTHERMESLADLMIAGGLRPEERQEAERHVAECPACRALVQEARDFAAWAKGQIAQDAPPADLEDRVIQRFRLARPTKKRRFIVGKRVLKVTGSIAAAVGLIVLGSMVHVEPDATRGDANAQQIEVPRGNWDSALLGGSRSQMHVHFTLDHDAHDHPADGKEIATAKPSGLSALTSAEADFRANDRDWNHRNDFWTGDVRGLYTMTGVPTASSQKYTEFFGGTGGELAALGDKPSQLGRELARSQGLPREPLPQIEERRKAASAADKNGLGFGEERSGKSTDLPDGTANAASYFSVQKITPRSLVSPTQGGGPFSAMASQPENGELPRSTTPQLPPSTQDNRKVIRNADVSLEVDSYDAAYTKLSEFAAAEKGFVSGANTQKLANGKVQATVVLRVPPDRFEAIIARFKELGTVRHQSIASEDVTKAYIDLESRLLSKQTLAERLRKLLAEGKGSVKELMEVEVQLGSTNEAIESIKGEIRYFDNRIGLSTITLQIAEKDLGQPFEYVQTLQANLALTVVDPDAAYVQAQKAIVDAGGQVVDSKMSRQSDSSSTGTIRGRVDADRFPALRDTLKRLGVATNDTVNQQKTAQGGREGMPKGDAPLRKEQAVVDLSMSSPPVFVTRRSQLLIETGEVESAYQNGRKSAEAMGGKIVDGSLTGRGEKMVAVLKIQADADKFSALLESLKTAGKVKNATVNSVLPTAAADGGAALLRERSEIELTLVSPPQLIADENGLGKSIRDTFANSWAGLLWSVEKFFVGISLAGPWLLLLGAGVYGWRRARRKKAPSSP